MQIKKAAGTAAALAMFVLILDGRTALSGAREGVTLCLEAVIPSLFPFFLLSTVLNRAWYGVRLPLLGKLFHMAEGTEVLLVPAFLGGYPVGAQSIGQLYREGSLPRREAQRLLQFCSNAGPAFLFGMGSTVFPSVKQLWLSWAVLVLSALTAAQMSNPDLPASVAPSPIPPSGKTTIRTALDAMAQVCAWVVAFRVAIAFLSRWCFPLLPEWMEVLCTGMLELTNGVYACATLSDDQLRFVLYNLFLSWGGLCVLMQTMSVTQGLSLSGYLKGKGMQSVFSVILSLAVIQRAWLVFPLWLGCILLYTLCQKKSSNSSRVIV